MVRGLGNILTKIGLAMNTYDLHITIPEDRADEMESHLPSVSTPCKEDAPKWKLLRINNVGAPTHHIISAKYEGEHHLGEPLSKTLELTKFLHECECPIQRIKIEKHILNEDFAEYTGSTNLVVEEHFKFDSTKIALGLTLEPAKDVFLRRRHVAGSNCNDRSILSYRFASIEEWALYRYRERPDYLLEVETELVVFDSNPGMDNFWPIVDEPVNLHELVNELVRFTHAYI